MSGREPVKPRPGGRGITRFAAKRKMGRPPGTRLRLGLERREAASLRAALAAMIYLRPSGALSHSAGDVDRGGDREGNTMADQDYSGAATLGEVVDSGNELWAVCNGCGHGRNLDLVNLVNRFGRSRPVPSLRQVFRCQRCGSRSVGVVRVAGR